MPTTQPPTSSERPAVERLCKLDLRRRVAVDRTQSCHVAPSHVTPKWGAGAEQIGRCQLVPDSKFGEFLPALNRNVRGQTPSLLGVQPMPSRLRPPRWPPSRHAIASSATRVRAGISGSMTGIDEVEKGRPWLVFGGVMEARRPLRHRRTFRVGCDTGNAVLARYGRDGKPDQADGYSARAKRKSSSVWPRMRCARSLVARVRAHLSTAFFR